MLDGKKVADEIKARLKKEIAVLKKTYKATPFLACLKACEDPVSSVYVNSQLKIADELGIAHRLVPLDKTVSFEALACRIAELNEDDGVHAIMIQTPLPERIPFEDAVRLIAPSKDVEGLHPENLGGIVLGRTAIAPCAAQACMALLRHYNIKLYGQEVVMIGHSRLVGKPLALMLLNEFATTTVCHIATHEAGKLRGHAAAASVLIVAVGVPELIKGEWIQEGSVVIDVGINRVGGRIVGDVEFEKAKSRASYITPVPGGVGPVTVMMLMKNCVELFRRKMNKKKKGSGLAI